MSLLDCKKLSIGYQNKVVCKDINFSVEKGDYVVIVGENGCGKSTLLKTILGLIKPLNGSVNFDECFDKRLVGYLPQQTDLQKDFPATVLEIVMSGFMGRMGIRPFYKRSEKEKAIKLLSDFGLEEYVNKSYRDLSGGQQQKVLLARALCATDELLVMDEPTNALDAKTIREFYSLIKRLNKDNGITIIMVSHNIEKVINDVSKIVYLKDKLTFVGTSNEFTSSEYAKYFNVEVK